jgi:hypothetical protein
MVMGGMDMTGFRMIPAGMGLMMPATAPWQRVAARRVDRRSGQAERRVTAPISPMGPMPHAPDGAVPPGDFAWPSGGM